MGSLSSFHMHTPTAVEFGVGVAAKVGRRAAALGMRHAMIVTDSALAASPMCAALQQSLQEAGVTTTVYSDVMLDPDDASVERATATYRASGANGLVALGGGSAMDTAKALGVLAVGGGDAIAPYYFGGAEAVRGIPPLICMPTTAGTGSEVTFVAIVTADGEKRLVRDPLLAPRLALIDPALTVSMPPKLTAATGMDALSHALEAMTSTLANPASDALAVDAIGRIARALPRAVAQGDDMEARSEMSLSAYMAGMAFLNGRVHLGHAVGHSFGVAFKMAHGLACIVCMPALLDFLVPSCGPELARIAAAFGRPAEAAEAPRAVAELMERCAIPRLGAAANVGKDDIPRLIDIVQSETRLIGLSRQAPTVDDWATIFEASL